MSNIQNKLYTSLALDLPVKKEKEENKERACLEKHSVKVALWCCHWECKL